MQNLNLYQPSERVERSGPQTLHIVLLSACLLIGLFAHAGWQLWQAHALETRGLEADAAAQSAETALASLSDGFTAPVLDTRLTEDVARQQAGNVHLARLEAYLDALEGQRAAGFASVLQALADQHLPQGLWLTGIALHQGGVNMRLQGFSQSQTLLPAYLDSLGHSKILAGREFAQFAVERDPSGLLVFSLDSQAKEATP